MKFLIGLLRSPSAYRGDWRGYFWNQAGHAYLVGGGLVWVGVPLIVVLAGYALWEAAQLRWFGATLDDAADDCAHVTIIAMAVAFGQPWLVVPQLLFLVAGVEWRRAERGRR